MIRITLEEIDDEDNVVTTSLMLFSRGEGQKSEAKRLGGLLADLVRSYVATASLGDINGASSFILRLAQLHLRELGGEDVDWEAPENHQVHVLPQPEP